MPRSKHRNGARSGSVKSRQRSDLTFDPRPSPTALTPALASQFVKLLHAGLPAPDAVAWILPTDPAPAKTASLWANSELTLAATTAFTHGPWEDLDPDQRLLLAKDKYLAECAYFLYTHQFATLSDEDRAKARYAYDQIATHLKSVEAVDDPVAKFLADMLAKNVTLTADGDSPDPAVGAPLPMH